MMFNCLPAFKGTVPPFLKLTDINCRRISLITLVAFLKYIVKYSEVENFVSDVLPQQNKCAVKKYRAQNAFLSLSL